jgi:hypothetical protein
VSLTYSQLSPRPSVKVHPGEARASEPARASGQRVARLKGVMGRIFGRAPHPAISSDGNDSYPEAMLETWGKLPEYTGRGRPPTQKQPQPGWKCLQVTKHRSGSRLIGITHKVVYGDPNEVPDFMGLNTAYVERTNLTSRQMNGRMVRKTLSFSKEEEMLRASCALEDVVYNLARPLKSLRVEVNNDQRRWDPRSPAMAAGLTDHIWTISEIMMMLAVPERNNA